VLAFHVRIETHTSASMHAADRSDLNTRGATEGRAGAVGSATEADGERWELRGGMGWSDLDPPSARNHWASAD